MDGSDREGSADEANRAVASGEPLELSAEHELLLEFIQSLTLCDTMNDALSSVAMVLGQLKIYIDPDPEGEIWRAIRKHFHASGVRTLTKHELTPEELERPRRPPPDPTKVLRDNPRKMGDS